MKNILWKIGHELRIKNISHASGTRITDANGKQYHDLESGVWCTPLGHCHPAVNQAVIDQLDRIAHTGYCYAHPVISKTADLILEITGIRDGACLFLTSGSEAVEVGVKAIQKTDTRRLILTLHDSFLGSMGSSGKKADDEWFLFDWTPCAECSDPGNCLGGCRHFNTIAFEKISGFVFEPGSASGLVRFPPKGLIQNIIHRIREHNGAVQINEITTGIGRTGKWFGFQHYDISPDIVSIGKGLGNGYPVSAAVFHADMIKKMEAHDFYHSQSHQNDPLGCAAASSVIKTIQKENLIEQGRSAGDYFLHQLQSLNKKYNAISQVRARGLMTAVDFSDRMSLRDVENLHADLIENGYIVAQRPGLKTFRIDPPLNIERSVLDQFITTLAQLLEKD